MSPEDIQSERIEDVDVSKEMQDSFLEYAYSVIYSRALPDARDGLKPVQRRILYLMGEMGLRPDKGHVKSARVVGEVMGKLHPHGDSAIYDALVRLAQDWTMRVPLVDGHGNFGSLDDGPAASRYTEARLAQSAMAMIQDLGEDVVNFVPNYDNQLQQPEVLPAAFPNLLVNGASGIAVGMATNMAPHNLGEVIAGARHLLDNPQASLEDLMNFIPGPDLPSGGKIVGLAGVRDAYATGRGSFKVRAKVSIENVGPRKTGLVVTELPYMVGPEKVIEKIKDGVNAKKITGISAVTDLTDRKNGLKLVITVKSGFDPEAILQELYRLTPLEDSFSINNVALVDGGPRTLGLRELLQVYVEHRLSVVTRRSQFRLTKRKERLHLVEGLLIAILDIDEVIQLIRASDDTETARTRLQEVFDLSEIQAEYILELRLRRLTKFSRIELETERDALLSEIAQLEELLASPALLRRQVSTELAEVAEQHGTPRRTILAEANATVVTPKRGAPVVLEIQDRHTHVFLSTTGHIVRVDEDESWWGTPGGPRSKDDAVRSRISASTRGQVGVILASGRVLPLTVSDLPAVPAASVNLGAGILVTEYLELTPKDRVVALCSFDSDVPMALATAQGVVKRVAVGEFLGGKPEYEAITLKPGDSVIGAAHAPDGSDLVLIADDAQLLRFAAAGVRPQGRAAGGMAGIKLAAKSVVIFFGVVDSTQEARVVTIAGLDGALPGTGSSIKVSDYAEFPAKGRATGGVRAHRFLKGEAGLALAWAGPAPVRAVSAQGTPIDTNIALGKRDGSGVPTEGSISSIGSAIHPDEAASE